MKKLLSDTRLKKALFVLLSVVCILSLMALVMAFHRDSRQADPSRHADVPRTTTGDSIPELLKQMNAGLSPREFPALNAERVAMLRMALKEPPDPTRPLDYIQTETLFASELLKAGKTEQALQEYQLIQKQVLTEAPAAIRRQMEPHFLIEEAVAYLRLGEQQNCCASNNSYSCLVPISGPGIHTQQYGSKNAIRCLTKTLQYRPDDLQARWLLNIAYMTIGGYPQAVPARWLIPLKDFGGDSPMKRFYNEAPQVGLDLEGWAGSVVMEDLEGNGLLDLLVSCQRPDGQLRYFHNNGDGTFRERTKTAGLTGETDGLNMVTTDYNNDGRPDVVVLRGAWYAKSGHFPLSLLRNDGGGHFTDVTISAGLLTFGPTQTATAFDYNGDGWLDLFVGYESTDGDPVPCKLFRNNGDGTFADVTEQCGLHLARYVKAVVSADYTHSGRPSLYLSCWEQPNVLLRNDGPAGADKSPKAAWKFTDVSHQAGVDQQKGSFSAFFFDYDNDGWPDIYVGGAWPFGDLGALAADALGRRTAAQKVRLYRNNGDGTFSDVSRQVHLDKAISGMGINFGDLDNDGWLDFYVGTGDPEIGTLVPNRMFRNHDGGFFDEVTTTGGFGHLQKGHGIAFGDINNNGQEDVFEVMGGAYEGDTAHDCLYVNPGNHNHWVTLRLEGVKSNRIALGAEIGVRAQTPQGERTIYRTVSTGGSFGNNPLRQEIGLGNATAIKRVTIHWPASGLNQVLTGLSMDCFYRIREGDANAQPLDLPTFHLPAQTSGPTLMTVTARTTH